MKRLLVATILLFLTVVPAAAAGKRPITLDDFFKLKRVSDPQISPDGKHVVYVVGDVDLAGNKITNSLWLAPTDKAESRQLTNPPSGKKDRHPRWSPDSKRILFESNRSGDSQLWIIDVSGGEARQVTSLSTGANTGIWSPDGKHIAFVSAVWPEYSDKPFKESDALNKKRKEEMEKNPVKARVFTKLFYRHWDEWVEDKRLHLFVMKMETSSPARSASKGGGEPLLALRAHEPRDVTPGDRDAYPTSSTFSVGDDFTFSPDGKHLVYTAPPERNEAWSTNYDICRVPISRGTKDWECLTKDNRAADSGPVFSPDGTKLAYRAQKRPGFEADRWELMVVDCDRSGAFKGAPKSVTPDLDSWAQDFAWVANGAYLCLTAEEKGLTLLYMVLPNEGKVYQQRTPEWVRTLGGLSAARNVADLVATNASLQSPPEVFRLSLWQKDGKHLFTSR